ncbi:hypothetical protein ACGCE5_09505 [Kluyvera ascorbata]|uniref:hypothetical protein n=1 Tax=Kluyvera ascorbata TaxID=51288 RepID=UPI00374DE4EA
MTNNFIINEFKKPTGVISSLIFLITCIVSIIIFPLHSFGMIIYSFLFFIISVIASTLIEDNNTDNKKLTLNNSPILSISILIFIFGISFYTPDRVDYFNLNPIWAVDNINRWHQDTAFNISLIRGILNWGYPTIGLDGHPLSAYHVLSHYVDAVLYKISKLDPYSSYGFTVLIKAVYFVNSIFILTYKVSHNKKNGLILFLIASPLVIASWHSVASHALWFTSFLLVFTASIYYKIIISDSIASKKQYIKIILICIALSIGKISTGVAFASFVFASMFFRDYTKKRFYISSFIVFIFLMIYQKFINYSYGIGSKIDLSQFNIVNILSSISTPKYSSSIFILLAILLLAYKASKSRQIPRVIFGLSVSYFSIILLNSVFTTFNSNDKYYFYYGLYSIVSLVIINIFSNLISSFDEENLSNNFNTNSAFIYSLLVIFGFFIYSPLFSLAHLTTLDSQELKGLKSFSIQSISEANKEDQDGRLSKLIQYINKTTKENGIKKNKTALFIPKNIVEKQLINNDEKRRVFYTMNIFAATGVQLINGFIGSGRAYGLANYDGKSGLKDSINIPATCKKLQIDGVISVIDYKEELFTYTPCH